MQLIAGTDALARGAKQLTPHRLFTRRRYETRGTILKSGGADIDGTFSSADRRTDEEPS